MSRPEVPTAKYFFGTHKESARQRGIPFHFAYEKWVQWWVDHLGPDWMSMRGPRDGQFVMARKMDKGPYADWNVECITANQNHSDMAKNGTSTRGVKNPMAKFTEAQILEIYLCKAADVSSLCSLYKISPQYVSSIKNKDIWGHVTKDFPPPEFKSYVKGEAHPNSKLTAAVVRQIYLAEGIPSRIGKAFGISRSKVRSIKIGESWRSVTQDLGPAPYKQGRGRRTDLGF